MFRPKFYGNPDMHLEIYHVGNQPARGKEVWQISFYMTQNKIVFTSKGIHVMILCEEI